MFCSSGDGKMAVPGALHPKNYDQNTGNWSI